MDSTDSCESVQKAQDKSRSYLVIAHTEKKREEGRAEIDDQRRRSRAHPPHRALSNALSVAHISAHRLADPRTFDDNHDNDDYYYYHSISECHSRAVS